jgi:hypothetical protein
MALGQRTETLFGFVLLLSPFQRYWSRWRWKWPKDWKEDQAENYCNGEGTGRRCNWPRPAHSQYGNAHRDGRDSEDENYQRRRLESVAEMCG